jgi:amino acid adenylation domain-containing protein
MLDFEIQNSGSSTVTATETSATPAVNKQPENPNKGAFWDSLAKMLEEQQQTPPLQPVDRSNPLPLSFAQERFWLLQQIAPENPFYNASIAFEISGNLNVIALEASLNEIIRRHEALRTQFFTLEGKLTQIVRENWNLNLEIVEAKTVHNSKSQIDRFLADRSKQAFDLKHDLLLRSALLKLSETNAIFIVTVHHIVFDKWSEGILCRELTALYNAFSQGQPSPLPELPIQYADFASWQRQKLNADTRQKQLDYWQQTLSGHLPRLALPIDGSPLSHGDYRGAKAHRILPTSLAKALKSLMRQEKATRFTILLAAFNLLLSRYTGEEDIIIGSPIATRNDIKLDSAIGCFLNSIALRTDLSGNPTFRELLHRVSPVVEDAKSHQDVPFEQVVEALGGERHPHRPPVFDVMLNVLNTPPQTLKLSGLEQTLLEVGEPESQFAMTLYVEEKSGESHLTLLYQRSLFSAERMAILLEQFEALLEQIVADPDRSVGDYSLITTASRHVLPDPGAELPVPEYPLITQQFATQARQVPTQEAIRQGNQTWSYRQLYKSAYILAGVLRRAGVSQGDVVAVCGERSFGVIAGMLGVFFSGGVLLTLDRNLPEERQAVMLREAKAKYLLSVGQPLAADIPTIQIDPQTGRPLNARFNDNFILPTIDPDDPAYIFFTSGTTGVPKGVLGRHKGLAHFLTWQRETFKIQRSDRAGQLTGLSFDVVLRDIFLPLTSGATLCLPDATVNLSAKSVLPWLEREQITLLHTVPSLAQSWIVDRPSGVSLRSLRRIFFAGEPLTDNLIGAWRQAFPEAGEIVNLYGPTETTLAKFGYRVPSENVLPGIQPVGFPQPSVQGLILSKNNRLCGIGEAGEIVIRTPFRSLGYINASQRDMQRFVQNPWGNDATDVLYQTGDRGRYRPDGSVEILGRIDRQVKIRGVRIEPGEIEAVLNVHPAVAQAVVVVREDSPGNKRLVAYAVRQRSQETTTVILREFLKGKLPQFMLPEAIVLLDSLPLTPNGKIDRRSLPAPDEARQEESKAVLLPRNAIESQLLNIWQTVLGINAIGVQDNFFELGGHSLMMVSLFDAIERELGKTLPMSLLFEAPTIESLAQHFQPSDFDRSWDSLVQIRAGNPAKPPLFLIHEVHGKILMYHTLSRHLKGDRAIYGLRPYGKEGFPILHTRIPEMVAYYIAKIRSVQPQGPYFLGGMCAGGNLAFDVALQLQAQGQEVAFVALFDSMDVEELVKANKVREQRQKNRRKESFTSTLAENRQSQSRLSSKLRMLTVLQRKVKGFVAYQLRAKVDRFIEESKLVIYRFCLDRRLPLPNFLRNIPVDRILDFAKRTYVIDELYQGRLTLFRATKADENLQHDRPRIELTNNPFFGWEIRAIDGVDIYDVPGGHASMIQEPNVRVLAEQLQARLDHLESRQTVG